MGKQFAAIAEYWCDRNQTTLDGLPTHILDTSE
jgi:hypothetical protein